MFDSDTTVDDRTRRAILKAAGGALGVTAFGGVASGHKYATDGHLGDQYDGHRVESAESTDVVGYHSLGGIGSASLSGSPDEPHYGAASELRVHDDVAVISFFSSRDATPGRGMAVLDVGQFTRAESADELANAELSVLSFFGNDNEAAACMDVKLSDDGRYAFVSKQAFSVLYEEHDDGIEDDDADDGGADAAALEVVDLSDPGNPELVAQTTLEVWALGPHNGHYHQIGGEEYFFTAHGEDGITGGINVFEFDREAGTLDLVNWWNFSSELAEPETEADNTGGEYYAHDLTIQDDPRFGTPVAYLANWNAGTRVLDVSDPEDIEELGVFEQDRSHHAVPAPTLQNGKRVFVAGHENPSSHTSYTREEGQSGHYYLVDADPLDAVLSGERDDPVYLGISSTVSEAGVEPASREAFEMYDPESVDTELDHWILFEDTDQTFDETPGFEHEAEREDWEYEGHDDFNLSSHNLDIDHHGNVVAGHYHAGTRFLEITDDFALEPTGYSRVGADIPEDAALEMLTTGTPFHWCAVHRNGVTFAGGINEGAQAIAHDDIPVGDDTPVDCSVEREADASLFTAGQTSQIRVHVDADEPVRVRDRIPGEWDVVGGDVSVEEISGGDRKVVTFDGAVREGTLRYFVEVPEELADTGAYTAGPVEYARPDPASEYGGGVSANNFLWRKENGETVTKTVVGLET